MPQHPATFLVCVSRDAQTPQQLRFYLCFWSVCPEACTRPPCRNPFRQRQEDCDSKRQGFTYSGVNAHHQSGWVERRMGSLQEQARSMLIHANHRWPTAITVHSWPCAVRAANDHLNSTASARFKHERSPIQMFMGSSVDINPAHWCTALKATGLLSCL